MGRFERGLAKVDAARPPTPEQIDAYIAYVMSQHVTDVAEARVPLDELVAMDGLR